MLLDTGKFSLDKLFNGMLKPECGIAGNVELLVGTAWEETFLSQDFLIELSSLTKKIIDRPKIYAGLKETQQLK